MARADAVHFEVSRIQLSLRETKALVPPLRKEPIP